MLKLGEKIISDIYLGDKKIAKAFLGNKLVFQVGKPLFLDYIESDGSQYIDTELLCSYDYTVKVKYAYTAFKSSYNCIFGARDQAQSEGNQIYWVGCNSNGKELMMRMGKIASTYTLEPNEVYELTINPNEATINGTSLGDAMYDGEIGFSKTIRLFSINDISPGVFVSSARLYYFQVYDKDMKLIQDLRPAIDRKGVVCMYDTVTKKYFYNQGTGTLIAGNKINFVDYISFDGESWVDVEYIPSSNTRIVGKVSFTQWHPIAGANYVFGVFGDNANFGFNVGSTRAILNVPWGNSSGISFSNENTFGQVYSFDISKNGVYLDGVLKIATSQLSQEFTATKSFFVGWSNGTSTQKLVGNIYPMQVYENDVLVKDLRPCIINDVVGLYDMVTGKFHINIGTGTLKPSGRFVDYIESSGTQYIDTGLNIDTCRVEIVAECTTLPATDGYQQLFSKNYDYAGCAVFACNPNWGVRSAIQTNTPSNKKSTIIADFSLENTLPKAVMTVDGVSVEYARTNLPSSANHNWSLMSASNINFGLKGRVYSCKMYDLENNLLRDLRPCIDPNNVVCMYDMVSGQYFYNQGTGEFGYGE